MELLVLGLLIGAAVGAKIGVKIFLARVAVKDYRETKAKVPVLLKLAIKLVSSAAGLVLLFFLVAAALTFASVWPELRDGR